MSFLVYEFRAENLAPSQSRVKRKAVDHEEVIYCSGDNDRGPCRR